jgi:hypothetical protein
MAAELKRRARPASPPCEVERIAADVIADYVLSKLEPDACRASQREKHGAADFVKA